jgi:hypothetical protein
MLSPTLNLINYRASPHPAILRDFKPHTRCFLNQNNNQSFARIPLHPQLPCSSQLSRRNSYRACEAVLAPRNSQAFEGARRLLYPSAIPDYLCHIINQLFDLAVCWQDQQSVKSPAETALMIQAV